MLLSALLVALALAPLAIQAGEPGREILGPMAIVILGGLVTSTLGVLFALPAIILALWRPGWASPRPAARAGRRARLDPRICERRARNDAAVVQRR